MVGCFVLGLLWVVVYYVTQTDYPIGAIGLWNMAIGFGLIIVGFGLVHPLEVAARPRSRQPPVPRTPATIR